MSNNTLTLSKKALAAPQDDGLSVKMSNSKFHKKKIELKIEIEFEIEFELEKIFD
jgi:hypothetical protein